MPLTVGGVHCTLHTAHCTLHTVHCTLYTAHCTLQTAHYTLYGLVQSDSETPCYAVHIIKLLILVPLKLEAKLIIY
jgi:hypothetical protein